MPGAIFLWNMHHTHKYTYSYIPTYIHILYTYITYIHIYSYIL